MNARDLMIGDWVKIKNLKNPIRQIICIDEYLEKVDFLDDKELIITSINNIFPIPLTPEILEKNGFIHGYGDSDFYNYEKWEKKVDDKTIRVIKDHDGWFCRVDDNKLTRSMGIAPAVHTMQNIIRIGGIEKTIEL